MNWDEYKEAFEFDGGSLRDICALNTTIEDWQTLLEFLSTGPYPIRYLVDDIEHPLSTDAAQIFEQDIRPVLLVNVQNISLKSHFFSEVEIEFDIYVKDITDATKAEAIFEFMSQMGKTLNKDVILTEESAHDKVWLRFHVKTGEIEFI